MQKLDSVASDDVDYYSNSILYYIYILFYYYSNQYYSGLLRGNRGQSSLRELLQPLVEGVLNDKNLSINTNPLEVYKAWINQTESETGTARYECIPLLLIGRD